MIWSLPLLLPLAGHPALAEASVTWTSPSRDSAGSMPLGNGDLAANVWVESDGDLLLLLAKSDAWDGNGRLLKIGRLRLSLTPNPFLAGRPFRQTLNLADGAIEISAPPVELRVWIDAHAPWLRVELRAAEPVGLTVRNEVWRTQPRELHGGELLSAYGLAGGPQPLVQDPDTVVTRPGPTLTWYHRNERSCWEQVLRHQGLGSLIPSLRDPLLGRTFGAQVRAAELRRVDPLTLRSAAPLTAATVAVVVQQQQTTAAAWLAAVEALEPPRLPAAWAAHQAWWQAFWERSWIRVSSTQPLPGAGGITVNDLPLRIGADSQGGNGFRGVIRSARIFGRALTAADVATLASSPTTAAPGASGWWDLTQCRDGVVANRAGDGLAARVVGNLPATPEGLRFDGPGYLEVAPDARLNLTDAVTLEAWLRAAELPAGGGRILDKSPVGTADGYLLDTWPGDSLRLIVAAGTLSHPARLPRNAWSHLVATYSQQTGEQVLYVDGRPVATRAAAGRVNARTVGEALTRGAALQRYLNAAAGRGGAPIKFNGSLFTVDPQRGEDTWDPDYRRWGDPYWFQNTRLPYWAMLPAGDFDLMQPLWEMYLAQLPLATARTPLYFGHAGAFFPETLTFWGTYAQQNYGWERAGKRDGEIDNTYIKWYWSSGLELLTLLLDRGAMTGDEAFYRRQVEPLARPILTFFDLHWPRRDGRIRFEPAQSLETWQRCIDPLPEIAGLRDVLTRLLALPTAWTSADRAGWQRLLTELPPLPTRREGGQTWLLPCAETLEPAKNVENPELYAVFPYRLYGVARPDLAVGRETFARRVHRRSGGWQQDAIQAAYLGLTADAAAAVLHNFSTSDAGSRFPAFWGPNYDWVPDQDHGNVALHGLQRMLLQEVGEQLLLCPAWPPEWDVEFRLHASDNTVLTGAVRGGKVVELVVTPAARARDVVAMGRPAG
ncbi:MAG: hypothetical protein IT204_10860 [Fimbriimonadaceae bacterium]|nr:hypothetical protein [Fimbriimonadaceae bacterium]